MSLVKQSYNLSETLSAIIFVHSTGAQKVVREKDLCSLWCCSVETPVMIEELDNKILCNAQKSFERKKLCSLWSCVDGNAGNDGGELDNKGPPQHPILTSLLPAGNHSNILGSSSQPPPSCNNQSASPRPLIRRIIFPLFFGSSSCPHLMTYLFICMTAS